MEVFNYLPGEDDGRKEELHQIDCASYIKNHRPDILMFHVANETGTKAAVQFVRKREAMGVMAGVADMIILRPTTTGGYPYSTVELKRPAKTARVNPNQKEFAANVDANGGLSVLCYGHLAFRRFLDKYYESA